MTSPLPRIHADAAELDDVTVDINRLRLQRIKRDCEHDLRTATDHESQLFLLASRAALTGDHALAVDLLAEFFALRTNTAIGAGGALGLLASVPLGSVHLPEELQRSLAAVDSDPFLRALASAPPDDEHDVGGVASGETVSHEEAMRLLFEGP